MPGVQLPHQIMLGVTLEVKVKVTHILIAFISCKGASLVHVLQLNTNSKL